MSENIPHSLGGFRGAFESEHGRKPTEQEIWNAAIRSWRDLTKQKSDVAKERVVDLLLEYAGDNGYSHIDYADTMRHAAALLQSTALPVGELTDGIPEWTPAIGIECAILNLRENVARLHDGDHTPRQIAADLEVIASDLEKVKTIFNKGLCVDEGCDRGRSAWSRHRRPYY